MFDILNIFHFLGYFAVVSVVMIVLAPTSAHLIVFGALFYVLFGLSFIVAGYDFIGILFIIVYAGALMVMFLFVVMAFDLARSIVVLKTSMFELKVTVWMRLVFFLLIFSVLFYFYSNSALLPFLFHTGCCTLMFLGDSIIFHRAVSSFNFLIPSILSDISTVFYQGFFIPLILCGFILVVGLIGAVSLTGGSAFLPIKRRSFNGNDLSVCGPARRIVLLS